MLKKKPCTKFKVILYYPMELYHIVMWIMRHFWQFRANTTRRLPLVGEVGTVWQGADTRESGTREGSKRKGLLWSHPWRLPPDLCGFPACSRRPDPPHRALLYCYPWKGQPWDSTWPPWLCCEVLYQRGIMVVYLFVFSYHDKIYWIDF